jgi:hypothetical protein
MKLWGRLLNLLPGRRRAIEAGDGESDTGSWRRVGLAQFRADRWGLRMAIRSLRRSRGCAVTCVAVLALDVGANTAVLSIITN